MKRIISVLAVAALMVAMSMATALPALGLEPVAGGFGDGGVRSSDTSPSGQCGIGSGQGGMTFRGGFDAGGGGIGGSCFDGGTGGGELCQGGGLDPDPQIPDRCVGS